MPNDEFALDPRFAEVGEIFDDLIGSGNEVGAAVSVWVNGKSVVELHGGWQDSSCRVPWTRRTLAMTYSTGKPLAAIAALRAVRAGLLTLDEPLATYWSAFGAEGKHLTTLRHVLSHSAGLPAFPPAASGADPADGPALMAVLAGAVPEFDAGSAVAEHALTYGHLIDGALISVGAPRVRDAIATLPGFSGELWFGVRESALSRVADLEVIDADWVAPHLSRPFAARCLALPRGRLDPSVLNTAATRLRSSPADGLFTSATSLARLYDDLARPDGHVASMLGTELWMELLSPQSEGHDLFLDAPATWSLGLRVSEDEWGMGGLGGSCAWHSRRMGYSMAYVTRGLGTSQRVDLLADAVERAL